MTTASLSRLAAELRFEDITAPVVRRAEDLLVDWFGSAIAGHGTRPVGTIAAFARAMGPADSPSGLLIARGGGLRGRHPGPRSSCPRHACRKGDASGVLRRTVTSPKAGPLLGTAA